MDEMFSKVVAFLIAIVMFLSGLFSSFVDFVGDFFNPTTTITETTTIPTTIIPTEPTDTSSENPSTGSTTESTTEPTSDSSSEPSQEPSEEPSEEPSQDPSEEPSSSSTTKKTTTTTTKKPLTTTEGGTLVQSGEQVWNGVIIGSANSTTDDVCSASDGYVVCGTSYSADGTFADIYGNWATPYSYVIKYGTDGSVIWSAGIGGNKMTVVTCVTVLTDGSVVAAGYTSATNLVSSSEYPASGTTEAFVVKYSANGTRQWIDIIGGNGTDCIYSIAPTSDGGYIVGGKTTSTTGDFADYTSYVGKGFLMKFSANGTLNKLKCLNGSSGADIKDISVDNSGNIFVSCVTKSTNGDFANISGLGAGKLDTVIFKYNSALTLQWAHVIASSGDDCFTEVVASNDGGCVVGGYYTLVTTSPDGTLEGIHNCGDVDSLMFKISADGKQEWNKLVAGVYDDYITDIVQITGGYAVVGYTQSQNRTFSPIGNKGGTDAFLLLTTPKGNTAAVTGFGGSGDDVANAVCVDSSNNIFIAGETLSQDGYFADINTGTAGANVGFYTKFKVTVKG